MFFRLISCNAFNPKARVVHGYVKQILRELRNVSNNNNARVNVVWRRPLVKKYTITRSNQKRITRARARASYEMGWSDKIKYYVPLHCSSFGKFMKNYVRSTKCENMQIFPSSRRTYITNTNRRALETTFVLEHTLVFQRNILFPTVTLRTINDVLAFARGERKNSRE